MKVVRKRIMAVVLSLAMILPALVVAGPRDVYAQEADSGAKVHNFTTEGKSSTFYQISGDNLASKGEVSYNTLTLTKSLKLNKNGKVEFNADTGGTLTLVFLSTNAGNIIKINDKEITLDSTGIVTETIAAGSVTIIRKNGESFLYYISFVPDGGNTGGDVPITSVTVDPKTASVKVGETVDLSASVTPANTTQSKDISWSSTEETIATVDTNGKVTAVAEGTVTITATSVADSTISDSCEVTVTANTGSDIAITGVTLDRQNASLKVGETTDLKASVTPANTTQSKDINWTSSDTSIATVDSNGKVTAVSAGTATITAVSAANNSFSASCQVVVISNSSSGNQGNLAAGGWNETIYAQIAGISKSDVTEVSYSGPMNGTLTGDDFTYLVRDLNGGGTH